MTDLLSHLREPATIRLRCAAITQAVADGRSPWFKLDRSRLPALAERVATLTLQRFPTLQIPLHSRWRHFEAGGVDRKAELDALLAGSGADATEAARTQFDLTVLSVLLDAGAGPAWRYRETTAAGEQSHARSEGLAVASFRAFVAGRFAADPARPLREGGEARPGRLFDRLVAGGRSEVTAAAVLGEVLRSLGPVWRSGSVITGLPAGDVWPHRFAGAAVAHGRDTTTPGWVPFHKLSQWLTYSLLEPLQWAGVRVTGLDALTGLPEYRNGGLFIDGGAVLLRNPADTARRWKPGDELVVEWRALTVTLLDELAALVRQKLGRSDDELPLACILEGGTWAAGRQIAAELRPDGAPPLQIDSDGTIF